MKHFVKVKDGVVITQPSLISSNPSDSPNTEWSYKQMILNGFYATDISSANDEYRDLSKPKINGDCVEYPLLKKDESVYLQSIKTSKINLARSKAQSILLDKYNLVELIHLGVSDTKTIGDRLTVIKNEINNLTKRKDVEDYIISYHSI